MRKGYDTIHLFLSEEHLPQGYSLEDYIGEEHITHRVNSIGDWISSTVKMDNLYILLTNQGLKIQNSFCNFSQHDNLLSFCEFELMEVLESIRDTYGVDIFKATVTRLDFFYDIDMRDNPAIYLQLLLAMPRFKVHHFELNKYFKTTSMEYAIYDKSKERKTSGNKLRFEMRLLKGVKGRLNREGFNLASLTARDLCSLDFRQKLETVLMDGYMSIKKDELVFNREDIKDYKSLVRYVMQAGINAIGLDRMFKELETYKKVKYLKKHQYYRFKKQLLKINNTESHAGMANHFIEELNTKMSELQKLQV